MSRPRTALIPRAFSTVLICGLIPLACGSCVQGRGGAPVRFTVTVPSSARADALTGRVYIVLSRDSMPEPRLAMGARTTTTPFFGVDVAGLSAGQQAVIDDTTLGYPLATLRDIPAGDYYVQAVVNVYTEFRRADGHTVWAHMDQWEGQHLTRSPGNLSAPCSAYTSTRPVGSTSRCRPPRSSHPYRFRPTRNG